MKSPPKMEPGGLSARKSNSGREGPSSLAVTSADDPASKGHQIGLIEPGGRACPHPRDSPSPRCSTNFRGSCRLPAVRVVEQYRGHRIVTDGKRFGVEWPGGVELRYESTKGAHRDRLGAQLLYVQTESRRKPLARRAG
jgi:hypothetical protein